MFSRSHGLFPIHPGRKRSRRATFSTVRLQHGEDTLGRPSPKGLIMLIYDVSSIDRRRDRSCGFHVPQTTGYGETFAVEDR